MRVIREALKRQFEVLRDQRLVIVDCRSLRDPERNATSIDRKHTGRHPDMAAQIMASDNFDKVMEKARTSIEECTTKEYRAETKLAIIWLCAQGAHRSEAIRMVSQSAIDIINDTKRSDATKQSMNLSLRPCYVADRDCDMCNLEKWGEEEYKKLMQLCYKMIDLSLIHI